MARTQKEFKWAHILTGGASGALDAINGNNLIDLDAHIVMTQTGGFLYSLDDDDGGSESSPSKIAPDVNAGEKMHLLQGLTFPNTGLKILETSGANTLTLKWNETDTADRILSLLVGGGNRSLTINEDFVIGDGNAGTLTFTGASKTLSVEDNAVVSQDYSSDASPTFASVLTDKVRATNGDGLYLVDDGDNGLFIKDGGNIGFNTTDVEAWDSSYKAIEGFAAAAVFHQTVPRFYLNNNAYYDGAWKYKKADEACQILLHNDGGIYFSVSNETGAENGALSLVTAMTIDNAGAVTVGDHGTAATDMVVNVCYGTGSAPTASDTTEGALFIKYVA